MLIGRVVGETCCVAQVWCLAVSSSGDFVITGSHDRYAWRAHYCCQQHEMAARAGGACTFCPRGRLTRDAGLALHSGDE